MAPIMAIPPMTPPTMTPACEDDEFLLLVSDDSEAEGKIGAGSVVGEDIAGASDVRASIEDPAAKVLPVVVVNGPGRVIESI